VGQIPANEIIYQGIKYLQEKLATVVRDLQERGEEAEGGYGAPGGREGEFGWDAGGLESPDRMDERGYRFDDVNGYQ
jgi:hypothetical protein